MSQKLPSISSLLMHTPSSSTHADMQQPPPILNLSPPSPPSPPLSMHSQPLSPTRSPFLSPATASSTSTNAKLSPLLSPVSYGSRSDGTQADLPPIHGDDPPRRLRLPSPSFSTCMSLSTPSSPLHTTANSFCPLSPKKDLFLHHHRDTFATERTKHWPSLSSPAFHTSCTINKATTISTNDTAPSFDNRIQPTVFTSTPDDNLHSMSVSHHRTRSKSFDQSSMFKKRKRGRPSISNEPNKASRQDPQFTFLTPAVYKHSSSQHTQPYEMKTRQYHSMTHANQATLTDPVLNKATTLTNTAVNTTTTTHHAPDSTIMMTAFTNSNMDTILNMPSKKRGRKPKTFLKGNSCFLWKDNTAKGSKK